MSEFRANCFAILEQVRKTRKPIRVTRYGKPFVEIIPPSPTSRIWLGSMAGTAKILGDIVGSISPASDWDAAR